MTISNRTFNQFVRLISKNSGIQLSEKHNLMLENRIRSRMQKLQCQGGSDYLAHVQADETGTEMMTLIDAATTNYTSFYRDPEQFRHLQTHLVRIMRRRPRRIRIWSSACSSGEEAYTIAICVAEAAKRANAPISNVRILASDISTSVLKQGSQGIFPRADLTRIPLEQQKYFEEIPTGRTLADGSPVESGSALCRIVQPLRELIIFRRLNLCDPSWQVPDGIDVIFCRNVLIYFDQVTQHRILANLVHKLADGGMLYVGACESVRDQLPSLDPVRPSVLRKPSRKSESAFAAVT